MVEARKPLWGEGRCSEAHVWAGEELAGYGLVFILSGGTNMGVCLPVFLNHTYVFMHSSKEHGFAQFKTQKRK